MGTTEKIAKFIVDFDFEAIPSKGIEQTKASIIDSVGAALLGRKEPVGTLITNFARSTGGEQQARLWGSGIRTSLPNATLANGVFIHAIDYDDGGGFGHHGAILVPPALALGEKCKLSGKKIIEAYAAAYEVGYKLLRSLGEVQFGAGFHSTSLLGTICAAAESSKLLELDVTKTRMALSIAASLSSGLIQNFGTHAKPLQVGRAAESGILSALLASEGFTGDPNIFEESRGYFYVYGQEQSSIKLMTENIGNPLSIAAQDMHFKQWPCCGGNYEVLTAIFDLLKEHDIKPDDIRDITVATSMKPPGPVNRPHPRNGMEGRFSLPYNVATALLDHVIDLSSFCDEKFKRPAVQDLMKKVQVVWHPDCADKPQRLQSESRFITIDIVSKDGRMLSKRQDAANRKQLNIEEVYEKYANNAKIAGIAENNISRAVTLVKTFEKCEDVTELVDLVCGS
jgi:2-methylcitrate dehydratase PrpD